MAHKIVKVVLLIALLAVVAGPAFAGDDPFSGLADTIDRSGSKWGPALLVLGALIAGGSIALGSHQAGEKVRNFLLGAIFLVLAAGAGAAILAKMKSLTGM